MGLWDDLYWTIVASCGRAPTAGEDEVKAAMKAVEAAIRADERAAWTKAIIGVAEEWSKQDAPDRPADLRTLVEEARRWRVTWSGMTGASRHEKQRRSGVRR